MSLFSSIYVCEQRLPLVNLNKSRFRSQLTDAHLNSTLKDAVAQYLVPDMNIVVNAIQRISSFFESQ